MTTEDEDFKTGGAIQRLSLAVDAERKSLEGRHLGDYRITRLIAEGGMGRVYRAERIDGSFERDVAVKISPGSGLNAELRARFLREQGFLAGLNHPNISQLYDAGVTEEGWSYIVMELIDGRPIDAYVESHRLDARAIVELMIEVTDAVAFAHNRLIVHRDIKPSNVLVTEEGRPKLVDFGIAKPLDPEATSLTTAFPLTPQSASPEQLLGKPITIGSDIYQLGLLLARLLLGRPLFRDETIADAIRRATEAKPYVIESALRERLPRDLALIIEQCLRPQPDERYTGANALRADLRAWRDGYPVGASGLRWPYRFGKFVARNRATAVTAAVAVIAAITGIAWYTWQLADARDLALAARQRAESEAVAAEQARAESEAVIDFLTRMLAAADPNMEGKDVKVIEVVAQAAAALEADLPDRPLVRARLHGEIGDTYQQLGFHAEAEAQQRAKLAIYDELGEALHPGRAEAHYDLAWLLRERGAFQESLVAGRAALELRRELFGEEDPATARAMSALANTHIELGEYERARELLERAIAVHTEALGTENDSTLSAMESLARMYVRMGRYDEAAVRYQALLAIERELYGEAHFDTLVTMNNWLEALNKSGRKDEALAGRRRQLELARQVLGNEHPFTYVTMVNLAMAFRHTEDHLAEREALLKAAIEGHRRLTHPEHPRVLFARYNLGRVYRQHGRYAEAEAVHRQNLPLMRKVLGADTPPSLYSVGELASTLCWQGKIDEAMPLFGDFAKQAEAVIGTEHPSYARIMSERDQCLAGRSQP